MADFHLVDPRGWEYDLQSLYTAYLGHFQLHSIPWYERSWGVFFESFEEFLSFSWPVITVTDCWTGKAHIVTRMTSIGAFLKMIKTRFGETLSMVDNVLRVQPFETSQRHMRTISDYASYKKLHSTLPAAVLAAQKARVRSGEPKAIQDLWESKDKTFLAMAFESHERNPSSCLEWGYAAARCGHLEAMGAWPPDPDPNYRRGHYIVSEYVDKVHNKQRPSFPWAYSFGESQQITKAKLPCVIGAVISSMLSPDSETMSNTLVLVVHGSGSDLRRLEDIKIKLPHNVLIIDTAAYERKLFAAGQRGSMHDPAGKPRSPDSTLSLMNMLQSLGVDTQHTLRNAGNDAFLCLLGLQLLLEPGRTKMPTPRGRSTYPGMVRTASRSPMPQISLTPSISPYGVAPSPVSMMFPIMGLSPDNMDNNPSSRRSSGYFPHIPGADRARKSSNVSLTNVPSRRESPGEQELAAKFGSMKTR
ncbi:hypothetical protein K474DRAFT_1655705 [Panus rudis PR-1116 ss-1]|nr:hypothetical protein K474DRAFT_1655705 [Panus rudis PR-1116 ss-1]